jgi:chaperone required for assembly of F1-ATPase
MRDQFENISPQDPVEAVRRAARPVLRRRFYSKAAAVATPNGYAVRLDEMPVHTPARRVLAAPSLLLAEAIAAEWNTQHDMIDPVKMPLTRLANAIIDGVVDRPRPVAAEIEKYLAGDLVFYRAGGPQGLVERQARHWDPVLAWASETLGAEFTLGQGIVHVAQPQDALTKAYAAMPHDPWRLGAMHAATTLTGSALLALAVFHGRLTVDEAWQAAHVDEDWNVQQWGHDEMAVERRSFRFAEFRAAGTVLGLLSV